MHTFLVITEIILAIGLILAVLLQVRGGGLGGVFGQQDAAYRTKRGIERTLFQLTIVMVILFILVSVLALKID